MLLGLGLLVLGVWLAWPQPEGPDVPGVLDGVDQYLAAQNLEAVHGELETLAPLMDASPARDAARFHQAMGDLVYLQQRQRGHLAMNTPQSVENNERAAAHYRRADELGLDLRPDSRARLAELLVVLDRPDDAMVELDRMSDQAPHRRYGIVRQMIQRQRAGPDRGRGEALDALVMRFEDEVRQDPDRARRREQLIWSAGLDARRMLEAGVPEQVIDQLLRQVHRFRREGGGDDAATDSDLLPLHLLLARAYQDAGRFDESLAQYQWAQRMLPAADPRQAQVMVGLGEVELAQGADAARQRAAELFESARRLDPHGPRYVDALIGLGDLYAVTGERFPEAVDALGEAAAVLNQDLPDWDPRRQRLLDVLDAHVRRTVELERYDQALVLLGQMLPMYGADGLPRRLVEQGAVIEEALGDAALQRAASLDPSREQPGDAAAGGGSGGLQSGASGGGEAFRMANQEAAEHYRRAAEHYSRLASMSVHDDQVHGEALWSAARNYDRAQAWERAIETYIDFVTHRGTDGRQIEASHQLALALLADGQVDAATQRLETLIREHPNSPWALASYVPLSRALEQRGQLAEAEARLRSLLARDQTVTPESDVYREALIELGRLSYERGEQDPANFARAVEVLHEAVQRFGDSREGASLRYMLGDALRRSALSLDESASARRSQRERLAYQSDRSNRLEQAEMYYDQAITLLEAVNAESLTPLERLRLRHAYLYKADCAFERGAYQIAIDRYRAAAQQYEQHPASLVALVQIVNAHCELGQYQEAAVANRQALWQLDRMPDDAFDDPSLPMTRQHWEDWLRWSGELGLYEDAPPVRSREDQRLGAAG